MKYLAAIAAASLAMAMPRTAYASAVSVETGTGNQLLATCSSDKNSADGFMAFVVCSNYMRGALDMAGRMKVFCAPHGVTYEQATDVVLNRLRADAANRHLPTPDLIARYLGTAFPCIK